MIAIRNVFHGIIACALVMIPSYIGLWLVDIGELGGMMDDDSYPMSIFILPVIAAFFSGMAFWIGVFPCAHIASWISNKQKWTLATGGSIAAISSATIGVLFGIVSGGLYSSLIYGVFLVSASLAFWLTTAKIQVDQSVVPLR